MVETSPKSLNTTPNTRFSLTCTTRAEVDGHSVPLTIAIKWSRFLIYPPNGPSELVPTHYTTIGSQERGYQSVLSTSEDGSVTTVIYRCIANTPNHSSFSDITVTIEEVVQSLPLN